MQWQYWTRRRGSVGRFALGLLAAAGIICVLALASPAPADPAEGREGAPQPFLSGGERSVGVLREIKEVLERIDSRLQRMEEKLSRLESTPPAHPHDQAGAPENENGGDR